MCREGGGRAARRRAPAAVEPDHPERQRLQTGTSTAPICAAQDDEPRGIEMATRGIEWAAVFQTALRARANRFHSAPLASHDYPQAIVTDAIQTCEQRLTGSSETVPAWN